MNGPQADANNQCWTARGQWRTVRSSRDYDGVTVARSQPRSENTAIHADPEDGGCVRDLDGIGWLLRDATLFRGTGLERCPCLDIAAVVRVGRGHAADLPARSAARGCHHASCPRRPSRAARCHLDGHHGRASARCTPITRQPPAGRLPSLPARPVLFGSANLRRDRRYFLRPALCRAGEARPP